jgi:2-dehydropantoate 2-reductase
MNILIFGAGSIGSLFGGLLSKNNKVMLVGRKNHIDAINKNGLRIKGLTKFKSNVSATEDIKDISFSPDIIFISVKAFDTADAVESIKKFVKNNTLVISLQNGLGNVEKIMKYVYKKQIFVCITTHGSVFLEPGFIKHTGVGKTIIGSVTNNEQNNARAVSKLLNEAGIDTKISKEIVKDIWIKVIINSSINPLTAIFNCKNGYLLENPILENFIDRICEESTNVANSCGFNLNTKKMINETKNVIRDTSENYSSMLQSLKLSKKTEVNEINGEIVQRGHNFNIKTPLNKALLESIKSL